MVSNQSQWLHNKKILLLQQLMTLQNQGEKVVKDYLEKMKLLQDTKCELQTQCQLLKRQAEERQSKLKFQLAQVEQILENKISVLDKEQDLTKQLQNKLHYEKSRNVDMADTLEQKKQNLRKIQQQFQAHKIESKKLMNQKLAEQKYEVDTLINKYENLIQDRVFQLQNSYQKQLQTVKMSNQSLLRQIELQNERKICKNGQQFKHISNEHERILEENKRLLSNMNQYKLKIINFENQVSSLTQQLNIAKKDSQYATLNLRRQIGLISDQNKEFQHKNRKLLDSIEDLNWEVRELKIKHCQDIKKMKNEAQKQISQCLESGMKSIKGLQQQVYGLKTQKTELEQQNHRKNKQLSLLRDQLQRQKKKLMIKQQQNQQNFELARLGKEHKKQIAKRQSESEALHEQINRLKLKVNKITTAYHEANKNKDTLEKQNKMLLSQIVFLRDKDKQRKKTQWSRVLEDVRSDVSRNQINQNQELQNYKHLIIEMQTDMHKALQKVQAKDKIIQKQKAIISRMEKALNQK